MTVDAKKHWENIYQTKKSNELSWHQENPKTSLKLISKANLDKDANIIDVGAGDSKLVDNLITCGFRKITLLDVSSNALDKAKKRLGERANEVRWIVSDLKQYSEDSMKKLFSDFECITSFEEEHVTPWNASQIFIFSMFKRGGKK